ncbi:hypothetical protein L484_014018 [Morus notabilis]|uniref:Uncharacterized protein n=1 Tax=Morus notabilis TaxID=981085 RepID=W9RM19_9ROSA|nr:hypothetical protein L484_014018 [Morus notabilis]
MVAVLVDILVLDERSTAVTLDLQTKLDATLKMMMLADGDGARQPHCIEWHRREISWPRNEPRKLHHHPR